LLSFAPDDQRARALATALAGGAQTARLRTNLASHFVVDILPHAYHCISTVIFRIHSGSGVPIYLQIEAQVKQAVAAGALERDEAMPSIRQLAAQLRVNPNTVARAYSNLEREGTIRTVPGGGTFVAARGTGLVKAEKLRRVRPIATQLAVEAKQVELTRADTVRLVEEAWQMLGTRNGVEHD
jgi:GntR family transcriptional regulator